MVYVNCRRFTDSDIFVKDVQLTGRQTVNIKYKDKNQTKKKTITL